METINIILSYLQSHFFYDARSSIITISVIFVIYFMNKMLKDKEDNPVKSLKYLAGTMTSFGLFLLMY